MVLENLMTGSLIELVRRRAAGQAASRAYTFLKDGEVEAAWLTYGGLERRSRALGALLRDLGAAGERVVLLFPPGLDFIAGFFGCLFAGAVAVPAYPPRPRGRQHALAAIVRDARPSLALTVSSIASRAAALAEAEPALAELRWLALDELTAEEEESWADRWEPPAVDAVSLAFLQYTSGSTSTPKGVMVSHGNLLHNEEMIRVAFGQSEESTIVSWLPLFHDMGLIGGVLQPLYLGASCVLMSPAAFLQRPARWLEAISRYGATTSGGPDFAYRLCLDRPPGPGLDLGRWSVAFVGAEPVRPETLERFAEAMAPHGFRREAFYPCYGLAEATLFATGGVAREPFQALAVESGALGRGRAVPVAATGPGAARLTACGRAWGGQEVAVVDPETGARLLEGEVGEIWIAGPSVAGGYWRRPEETASIFGARMAGEPGAGPFLRTGDLGFQWRGDFYVAGRLKDLIILRGRNLYPQDLELTVERSHPDLRPGCGAVFAVAAGEEERLVAVQELSARGGRDLDAVAAAVFRAVFEEHEVRLDELVLIEPGTIPKTSSGKIQRAASRAAYLDGALSAVGRRGAGGSAVAGAGSGAEGSPEAALRRQVGEALGIPPDRLPLDRPLVTLGLDSLAAVRLHHLLPAGSGAGVSPVHLLADCTLADLLARAGAGGPPPASREAPPPATDEEGVPAPLSHGQKSLWFLQRLAPGRTAYNVVVAARVLQGLDAEALRRAVARLIDRHPALRTTFVEQAGEPWQVVGSAVGEDPVRVEDWDGTAERLRERLEAEAGRPFDLESGPLLRVLVWRLHRESVLQLIVQHIAVDFWSLSILAGDLGALYAAEVAGTPAPAPLPRATYLDFVRWQRRLLASERGERLRAYWEGALTPLPPALALPTDRPRGPVQSFAGDAHTFALDAALTERVRALAAGRGMTAYTVLLAAFQTLLARLSGATSLVIGSPAAGRGDAAFAETVGYFVNPVVLRADLGGDPTFEAFLGRTQAVALAALEHQDYPFLLLAERLEGGREPGRPPVFQVMFTLQKARLPREAALAAFACGQEGVRISLGGLELESMSCRERTAQTDLSLALAEVAGRLCGQLRYATGLFDGATAQRLARGFRTLLAGALAAPGRRVSELPLLAEEERRQVLRQGRRRTSVWPPPGVPALMAAAARRSPDAVAVEGLAGALLRYGELAGRSGRVAAGLRAAGVGPEILVGVALERSPDLLVALLGVLRAGGACLLLDPLDERAGLERMLELSGCRVLLTRGRLAGRLPEHGAMEIHLERLEESARDEEDGWREIDPDGLAFVVRTAGGRRQPRLVCLTHRSLAAWLESWAGRLGPEDLRAVTGEGAAGTIDGLFDLLLPVCLGGRAVLDPALARPSLRSATPTRWAVELRAGTAAGTRVLRSSGEVLTEGLRTRLLAAGARAVYDSFASALGGVWPSASSADVYVLDRSGEPVPAGVAGDLWLGGAGLARGYLADPEETARRFRPDPFGGLPGARLAFTGDRARWRSDGRLEILGAAREVEAGGRRFDPGLVEEVLAAHPRVLRAVAGVQREGEGARLVAHVLGAGPAGPPAAELREYLRGRLPETQVPWTFAILDELPRTPAGRIDTRALPRIAPLEPLEGAAPRTEIERMLVEIWRELLQIDRVGIHDNFFQLGGNSLLATQAVVRMNQAFQLSLGVETLFRSPTVASLAMTTDEHLIAQLGEEALEFL